MPLRLDSQSPDFAARFAAFLARQARGRAGRGAGGARHHRRGARLWRPRAVQQLTLEFDRVDLGKIGMRVTPAEIDAAAASCDARGARRAQARARPHRGLSPPPEAAGRALHRRARRRTGRHAGRAIEAVGLYVPGGTAAYPSSVLMNAVPAKVAGVRAPRHGGAGAGRQALAAGAGGGQARRRRRDLSHRRRAGDGGARLRHRDDRAGRQDRRARQRLCGGGQAPGVRPGRHRHDRRPVRGARSSPTRPATPTGSPPICWRRPSTTPARNRS